MEIRKVSPNEKEAKKAPVSSKKEESKVSPKKETKDKSPERKMVVKDIKFFLWIFILIIVILVGVGLIISKTDWLNPVTDWITGLIGE